MKKQSPLIHVLKALVPYSRENLTLSFKPSAFFAELENNRNAPHGTHSSAFYRAVNKGLIEYDGASVPRLTARGRAQVKRYEPEKLSGDVYLLVSFDIPESERAKRDHLRLLLRELSFKKVQQSLWATKYDHREYLAAEIKEFGLKDYVNVYEALKLNI